MLAQVFKEISDFLNFENYNIGRPFFSDERYKTVDFSEENFHSFEDKEFSGKVCFIDGGNLELINAPNFSVQLVRVYYNIYQNNKKQKQKLPRIEFFSVSKSIFNSGIKYLTKLIPTNADFKKYAVPDQVFEQADNLISFSGQYIRRMMEWNFLSHVIDKELCNGDAIVMDGTLQTLIPNEKVFVNNVFEKCVLKKVLLTSLAKTSRLYTTTGAPLIYAVNSIAPAGKWFYHPIVKGTPPDHCADIYITKLHGKSDYIFRFETNRNQQMDNSLFNALSKNSTDSTFLGYPYGLVDTDKNAKVSKNEKDAYLSMLYPKLSNLKKFITSSDAHDILNVI